MQVRAIQTRESRCYWLLLFVAAILLIVGINWGLPSNRGWAADELFPRKIFAGFGNWFSLNEHSIYPPLHFYLLGILYQLVDLVDAFVLNSSVHETTLFFLNRGVSVLMALGILTATYRIGTLVGSPRAAVFAVAALTTNVTFVYYGKMANVDIPATFWFAWSLYYYLLSLRSDRLRDYLLLSLTATFAVCTKDQMYGFYLFTALHLIIHRYRINRQSLTTNIVDAVFDRWILASALTCAIAFSLIHKLPWNLEGFLAHLNLIQGPASERYQVYTSTIAGQLRLLAYSAKTFAFSFSWPIFVVACLGIGLAIVRRGDWLLLSTLIPLVSYHVTFLAVVLYCYDRFLLPSGIVIALFFGFAADLLLRHNARHQRRIQLVLGLCLLFAFSRAVWVDLLMITDSRYTVERWIAAHVDKRKRVGLVGPREYLPRVETKQLEVKPGLSQLKNQKIRYLVVNNDLASALEPERTERVFYDALAKGETKFSEVFRYRTKYPVNLLNIDPQMSNLSKINPEIIVYHRPRPSAAARRASRNH